MDFEPVPDVEVAGYRIAPITAIEPGYEPSGDAWVVCPDGTHIDLTWRAEEPEDDVVWAPSTVPGGKGVISVRCRGQVHSDADLEGVLELAVTAIQARQ